MTCNQSNQESFNTSNSYFFYLWNCIWHILSYIICGYNPPILLHDIAMRGEELRMAFPVTQCWIFVFWWTKYGLLLLKSDWCLPTMVHRSKSSWTQWTQYLSMTWENPNMAILSTFFFNLNGSNRATFSRPPIDELFHLDHFKHH
jgi:hypothetical protein